MIELDVLVPPAAANVPALIKTVCAAEDLTCTLTGTLKTHPGSLHWHFKRGTAPGVLEITWVSASRKLWLTMQLARAGNWIEPAMLALKARIERA